MPTIASKEYHRSLLTTAAIADPLPLRSSPLDSSVSIGRRRPGDALRFAAVTIEAAEELCRAAERQLAQLVAGLEPVTDREGVDVGSLYGGNLISGVVTGLE